MNTSDLMQAMADAGAPFEAIILAVRALEAKDEAIQAAEQEAADKRAAHAEWKRNNRAAKRELDNPSDVHGLSMDMARTVHAAPPALDKEIPPRPPKEINPTPRATRAGALARKAGGFGPPNGVDLTTWNVFCSQRKKPVSEIAYTRMLTTLAESADAGWPPGEIVERSIEKNWETLFTPSERRNGKRNGTANDGSIPGLGRTGSAAISVFGAEPRQDVEPDFEALRRVSPRGGGETVATG